LQVPPLIFFLFGAWGHLSMISNETKFFGPNCFLYSISEAKRAGAPSRPGACILDHAPPRDGWLGVAPPSAFAFGGSGTRAVYLYE